MPNGLALAISLLIVLMFSAYIVSVLLLFFTPYYSTPKSLMKKILEMYDCLSVGYEISPVLLMIVKLRKLLTSPLNSKIHFKEESFFNTDLSQYDVIYCCLPEDVLKILEKKFNKELKKGTKVFTYKNKLPKKKGKKIDIDNTQVYQYTY